MKCINKSHPTFQELLKNSNLDSFTLELEVSNWQEVNNTDKFPTLNDLKIKNDLINKLKEFLSDQGINLTTLEDYFKIHEARHNNVESDSTNDLIKGLTDVANKTIALENLSDYQTLSEETIHIAVAYMQQHSAYKRATELVVDTSLYKQHKEQYFKTYKKKFPNLTNAQIEQLYRVEIVGKLANNQLINKLANKEGNIGRRIIQAVKTLIKQFRKLFKQDQLQDFLDSVENVIVNKNYSQLVEATDQSVYFSLDDTKFLTLREFLESRINNHKQRLKDLKDKTKNKKITVQIKRLEEAYDKAEYELGLYKLLKNFEEDANAVLKAKTSYNRGKNISSEKIDNMRDFVAFYKDDLELIRTVFSDKSLKFSNTILKAAKNSLNTLTNDIMPFLKELQEKERLSLETELNLNPEYDPKDYAEEINKDSNFLQYWFGSLRDSSKEIHRIVHKLVQDKLNIVHWNTVNKGKELVQKLEDLGYSNQELEFIAEVEDGKRTGYFIDKLRWRKFKSNFDKFRKELHKKFNLPEDNKERYSIKEGQRIAFNSYTHIEIIALNKKKNLTIKEQMAVDFYNYRIEVAQWFEANTKLKEEYETYNYKGSIGLQGLIREMKDTLSKEEYKEWALANLVQRKNGSVLPKGELVQPSTGSIKKGYKNKKISTVDYTNYEYDRLSIQEKKALDIIKELHKESTNTTQTDPELLPQITASKLDLWKKGSSIKDKVGLITKSIKEDVISQEDDTEFGDRRVIERPDGTKRKFVPIYYDILLENVDDRLSPDYVSSVIQFYEMSEKYREMSQIAPQLENTLAAYGDKKVIKANDIVEGKASTIYKELSTFIDMLVYGQSKQKQELTVLGKTVNVTKIVQKVNKYFRDTNLMLNPFTATTGYLSGAIFSKQEDLIGKYTNQASANKANKFWLKNISQAALEWGKANTKSDLNIILETFGINKPNFKDLNKARLTRKAIKSGLYWQYELYDYRTKGKLALSVLYKNDLINENGSLKPMSLELKNRMFNTIQFLANRIDGQLSETDKAAAHQHAIAELVTTHRGWLFRNIQDRFKTKGVNYMTEEFEVGFYRAGYGFVFNYIKDIWFSTDRINSIKSLMSKYNTLEPYEKEAVRRLLLEQATVMLMITVASLINAAADEDEEDNYALDTMAYLANRTLLETASLVPVVTSISANGIVAGSPMITELTTTLDSPFILTRQIDSMADFMDFFSPDILTRGQFEGYPKVIKNLIKLTPGLKGIYTLRDPSSSNQFLKSKPLKYLY